MKKSSSTLNAGLEWVENNRLCDLDFADDIVLIDNSQRSMQQMTRAIESEANKVGLRINADKCKVMVTQAWNDGTNIEVEESTIEVVHDFCYLGRYISRNSYCDKKE